MLLSWAGQPEVGWAACLRSPSTLHFADVAQHHSTLLLKWVVSPFDDLGTGRWAFELILVPSGSTDSVGALTRGSGSQLVNAVYFLVPDVDARGNTVTHGFILVPATGSYVQQRGVRGHCIILHPECL